ncbi:hypothetical protein BC828DRAFT_409296 [Blastocladiella britannica]|nr:hypothetical protein BC828DRAFT_409296 [Blastocladiella britannica]
MHQLLAAGLSASSPSSSPSMASAPASFYPSTEAPTDLQLVQERDALRAQNEQLWALVEKQRHVIFSLKAQVERLRNSGAVETADPAAAVASAMAALANGAAVEKPSSPPPRPSPSPPARPDTDGSGLPAPLVMPGGPQRSGAGTVALIATPPMTPQQQQPSIGDGAVIPPATAVLPPTTASRSRSMSGGASSAPTTIALPTAAATSAADLPPPPTRSNTYPAPTSATVPPPSDPVDVSQYAPPPPRRAAIPAPLPLAAPPSAALRVAAAADTMVAPLSPKPLVAGGPASRASVISLNDPRYSYLAFYDDLTGGNDLDLALDELPGAAADAADALAAMDLSSSTTTTGGAAPPPPPPKQAGSPLASALPGSARASPSSSPLSAAGAAAQHRGIVPANKAFRLGRLRPSSQLGAHERRPTVRVQFAAETIVHEASDEEFSDDDMLPPPRTAATGYGGGDDDDEYNGAPGEDDDQGSEMTASDLSGAVAQGAPQFPQRSRSSMVGAGSRSSTLGGTGTTVSGPDRPVANPPPRQHSRTAARDSIFLSKNSGGRMYFPPRAYVNETRMSMMGGAGGSTAAAAAALMGGAAPASSPASGMGAAAIGPPALPPSGLPTPSAVVPGGGGGAFPVRGASSSSSGAVPTPAAPASGGAMPPMRTAQSPSRPMSQHPSSAPSQQQQQPAVFDEELLRRLLSGDRAALQDQVRQLSPSQIAQLQTTLRDRMAAGQR